MQIVRDVLTMQQLRLGLEPSLGFVPTMGALHEGHFTLVEQSRRETKKTAVSIFVNPTQFNNVDDLKKYPNTIEKDIDQLQNLGVDFLFLPTFEALYPDNYNYSVQEKNLTSILCGASRPGHFSGVLTVVLKLLNILQPSKAYFGEKDFQQLSLIQGMAHALFLSVEIVPVPTVRDSAGLALSSRNLRLSPEGLLLAQKFAQTLKQKKPLAEVKNDLKALGLQIDYLEDFQQRRMAAVFIDDVRLIDNVPL